MVLCVGLRPSYRPVANPRRLLRESGDTLPSLVGPK